MCSGRCDDLVPLLGYYIPETTKEKRANGRGKALRGFYGFYQWLVGRAIQHRWRVLAGSFLFLLIGVSWLRT